jgi:hypothetical protein
MQGTGLQVDAELRECGQLGQGSAALYIVLHLTATDGALLDLGQHDGTQAAATARCTLVVWRHDEVQQISGQIHQPCWWLYSGCEYARVRCVLLHAAMSTGRPDYTA